VEEKTVEHIFDSRSAIRERLFLLSVLKDANDSANWAYDPHRDVWSHADGAERKVRYEGSRSLEVLASRGIDRKQAMEMIGYPEKH
jgi:hypothetical protein